MTDLPPPDTKRWSYVRKAAVARAVGAGEISREEACHRWSISSEELAAWEDLHAVNGPRGLRATYLQEYDPDHQPTPRRKRERRK